MRLGRRIAAIVCNYLESTALSEIDEDAMIKELLAVARAAGFEGAADGWEACAALLGSGVPDDVLRRTALDNAAELRRLAKNTGLSL